MCKYCDLVSGEFKDLGKSKEEILFIERHGNIYSISTNSPVDDDERTINYCPMCGRKLNNL